MVNNRRSDLNTLIDRGVYDLWRSDAPGPVGVLSDSEFEAESSTATNCDFTLLDEVVERSSADRDTILPRRFGADDQSSLHRTKGHAALMFRNRPLNKGLGPLLAPSSDSNAIAFVPFRMS